MTRVALVVPESKLGLMVSSPPLSLGYLASYLRGHCEVDVKLFDGSIGQNVKQLLLGYQPDVVGVSATTPLAPSAYRLAAWIKQVLPDTFRVMGGVHASVCPNEAAEHFDCVVVGEGEQALVDIVRNLEQNRVPDRIVQGGYIPDLNCVPMPAFDLMDIDGYIKLVSPKFNFLANKNLLGLITSRGCPYKCSFCWNSHRQSPTRYFSAERVVEEVKYVMQRYHVNLVDFHDDEFVINRKRLNQMAALFKEYGLNGQLEFVCQGRAPSLTIEALQLLKSMGCCLVSVGFETGSQRILDAYKKGTVSVRDNWQAAENARRVGLPLAGSFIFGWPDETREEMMQTRNFFEKTYLSTFGLGTLIPYPETDVWKLARAKGLLPEHVDYERLVPTSKPKNTYILNTMLSNDDYDRFLVDSSRLGHGLARVRRAKGLKRFGLVSHRVFWYIMLKYPRKLLSVLTIKDVERTRKEKQPS